MLVNKKWCAEYARPYQRESQVFDQLYIYLFEIHSVGVIEN
jgi:hypothetical protein